MYTIVLTVQNDDGIVAHSKQLESIWSNEFEDDFVYHRLIISDEIAEILAKEINKSITPEFIKELLQ